MRRRANPTKSAESFGLAGSVFPGGTEVRVEFFERDRLLVQPLVKRAQQERDGLGGLRPERGGGARRTRKFQRHPAVSIRQTANHDRKRLLRNTDFRKGGEKKPAEVVDVVLGETAINRRPFFKKIQNHGGRRRGVRSEGPQNIEARANFVGRSSFRGGTIEASN